MPKVFTTLGICPQKYLLFISSTYFRHMSSKEKVQMIPRELKLPEELDAELNEVAEATGEPAAVIIRLSLRAGLAKIKAENYKLFSLDSVKSERRVLRDPPQHGRKHGAES